MPVKIMNKNRDIDPNVFFRGKWNQAFIGRPEALRRLLHFVLVLLVVIGFCCWAFPVQGRESPGVPHQLPPGLPSDHAGGHARARVAARRRTRVWDPAYRFIQVPGRSPVEDRVVAYRGPSAFSTASGDTGPVRAVLYGARHGAENEKTVGMVQVAVLPDDFPPQEAVKMGRDVSVCGQCQLRGGACYVETQMGLPLTWKATNDQAASMNGACDVIRRCGRPVRFTSYGDIAALPVDDAMRLLEAAESAGHGFTGYTHAWRACDPRLKQYLRASVDSLDEQAEAEAMGWLTFRIRREGERALRGEFVCCWEASEREIGCGDCLRCAGTVGRFHRNIVETVHGGALKEKAFSTLTRTSASAHAATVVAPGCRREPEVTP